MYKSSNTYVQYNAVIQYNTLVDVVCLLAKWKKQNVPQQYVQFLQLCAAEWT